MPTWLEQLADAAPPGAADYLNRVLDNLPEKTMNTMNADRRNDEHIAALHNRIDEAREWCEKGQITPDELRDLLKTLVRRLAAANQKRRVPFVPSNAK
jgi:ABC-type nitrate/sulfonate/bicarbonate transport system substrate-binding protein